MMIKERVKLIAAVGSEPEESLMPCRGQAAALREDKLGKEP